MSIPDEVFKPARARLLSGLLDGPVFHTQAGRERWEDASRHNATEEIRALTS